MSNEPDEVNSGALATALVLVAFSTLAVALVVTSLVRNTLKEVRVDKDQTQERAFRNMKTEQVASLNASPAWRDRATGLVSVPVERAMALVLSDIRANPYAMSPGYKPPEEKSECAEPAVCTPCAEGEVCAAAACPQGQKCSVPCVEGQDCGQTSETAVNAPAVPVTPPATSAPKSVPVSPTPAPVAPAPVAPAPVAPAPVAPAPAPNPPAAP